MVKKIEKGQSNQKSDLMMELKESYDSILDGIIELTTYYNYETALEIFYLFNCLCSFFSDDDKFKEYKSRFSCRELENRDTMGIQTLLYGGICRHKSAMLCDIYDKSRMDSIMLLGSLRSSSEEDKNDPKSDRLAEIVYEHYKDQISNLSCNDKTRQSYIQMIIDEYRKMLGSAPNHAIVMVGDDKKHYFDPANSTVFYSSNGNDNRLINNLGKIFVPNLKAYQFVFKENGQDYTRIYRNISQKKDSIETEDDIKMQELYFQLMSDVRGIAEFIVSKEQTINTMKEKVLTLTRPDY